MSPKKPRKPAQPVDLAKRLQAQKAAAPQPPIQIITQEQAVLRALGDVQQRIQNIEKKMNEILALLVGALNTEAPTEEG